MKMGVFVALRLCGESVFWFYMS